MVFTCQHYGNGCSTPYLYVYFNFNKISVVTTFDGFAITIPVFIHAIRVHSAWHSSIGRCSEYWWVSTTAEDETLRSA